MDVGLGLILLESVEISLDVHFVETLFDISAPIHHIDEDGDLGWVDFKPIISLHILRCHNTLLSDLIKS
jgi:hypothetical protein